jgi:hypothetical protein
MVRAVRLEIVYAMANIGGGGAAPGRRRQQQRDGPDGHGRGTGRQAPEGHRAGSARLRGLGTGVPDGVPRGCCLLLRGEEVTELSTNKQHTLSLSTYFKAVRGGGGGRGGETMEDMCYEGLRAEACVD